MLGEILWGIIGGAFVGVIGRLLLPGRQNISMLTTVIAGILAAQTFSGCSTFPTRNPGASGSGSRDSCASSVSFSVKP
jgi:uncharacterized membrane protein YeaQ/YmgE (transglycosylase-associated protein family)